MAGLCKRKIGNLDAPGRRQPRNNSFGYRRIVVETLLPYELKVQAKQVISLPDSDPLAAPALSGGLRVRSDRFLWGKTEFLSAPRCRFLRHHRRSSSP